MFGYGFWGSFRPGILAFFGHVLMIGMFLMLDIVVNNMAYKGDPNNVDFSTLHPLNDQSYFHRYCPINYSDRDSTLNVTPLKQQ